MVVFVFIMVNWFFNFIVGLVFFLLNVSIFYMVVFKILILMYIWEEKGLCMIINYNVNMIICMYCFFFVVIILFLIDINYI